MTADSDRLAEALEMAEGREDVDAVLDAFSSEGIGRFALLAMELLATRGANAMWIFAWIARQPVPARPSLHEEWLRAHNNACHLATFYGDADERRAIVERALPVAAENIAIYHNAACVLCKLGDTEVALAVIREAIDELDAAAIRAIAEDADLDLIRHGDPFRAIVEGRSDFALPTWADGWSAWQYTQFRELVRTSLYEPDLSRFDEGIVESRGKTFDVRPLADRCRNLPTADSARVITAHFT